MWVQDIWYANYLFRHWPDGMEESWVSISTANLVGTRLYLGHFPCGRGVGL